MTNRQWTLLVVRGLGLWMLMHGLMAVPHLCGVAYALAGGKLQPAIRPEYGTLTNSIHNQLLASLLTSTMQLGMFAKIGVLLIRSTEPPRWLGFRESEQGDGS